MRVVDFSASGSCLDPGHLEEISQKIKPGGAGHCGHFADHLAHIERNLFGLKFVHRGCHDVRLELVVGK